MVGAGMDAHNRRHLVDLVQRARVARLLDACCQSLINLVECGLCVFINIQAASEIYPYDTINCTITIAEIHMHS